MIVTILWALIGGVIIGLLGKWIAPGHRDIPLWATILCGIGGIFLGNWLYVDVFNGRIPSNTKFVLNRFDESVADVIVGNGVSLARGPRSAGADPRVGHTSGGGTNF